MKKLPWWSWLLILLLPGGFAIAAFLRVRQANAAPRDVDKATPDKTASAEKLIGAALENADALRAGLKNDALAASLIGVDPALIAAPSGDAAASKAAETTSKRDALLAQLAQVQENRQKAYAGWGVDHFGGQSESEFSAILGRYDAEEASINVELARLVS